MLKVRSFPERIVPKAIGLITRGQITNPHGSQGATFAWGPWSAWFPWRTGRPRISLTVFPTWALQTCGRENYFWPCLQKTKKIQIMGLLSCMNIYVFIPAGPGGPGNPISPCPLAPFMPIGPISPVRNTFKHPFPFSHLIIIKRWINFQTDWHNSHLSPLQVPSSLEFPGSLESLPCRDTLGVQMGPLGLGDLDHLLVLVWFHSVGSCFGPSPAGAVAAGLLKEHLVQWFSIFLTGIWY